MSIIIKNLSKSFYKSTSKKIILNCINLDINSGEVVSLMGPNGAGKTTLLKILATLILPDMGEVEVNGLNIIKHPEKARDSIGFVYDSEHSFYQILSVKDNLKFFGMIFKIPNEILSESINQCISKFKLIPWKDTKFSHCPSGVKQKIAIIRALLRNPQILLFDEPSRSLDTDSKKDIHNYIREIIIPEKKTFLFVTHDLEEAKNLSNQTLFLENGQLRCIY